MRILLLLPLITALLFSLEIDSKIDSKKESLKSKKEQEKELSRKLKDVAASIIEEQKELKKLQGRISSLDREIEKAQKEYEAKKSELEAKEAQQEELLKSKQQVERQIIEILAKELSFSILISQERLEFKEDLMRKEIFYTLSKITKESVADLKKEHKRLSEESAQLNTKIEKLKSFIAKNERKKENLLALKNKKDSIITSLSKKRARYDRELKEVIAQKKELQNILAKLNILRDKELKKLKEMAKAREKRIEQAQKAKKQAPKPKPLPDEKIDVRQVASSYHTVSTSKYSGKKTIAPLESFEVDKKFGPYYDPIYNMKVFNESVTLLSRESGAKVKSVLQGEVVFADETPVLNKVVIIEHPGNMHTIYAHMDRIAPTIRPGVKVKKGYTLGRVAKKLIFEVTKKNRHIDPLELIAIN